MLDQNLDKGWMLLKSVIDKKTILDMKKFLNLRTKIEFKNAERWFKISNIKISNRGSLKKKYSEYQKLLPFLKKKMPSDLQHFLVGEYGLKTRLSNKILNILCSKNLHNALSKVLNLNKIYIHYPPMVRFNFGSKKSHVPSHQDHAYNCHLKDFITVWVPVTKIDQNCPGLIVYNKSHSKIKKLKHTSDSFWSNRISNLNGLKGHHVEMNIGDILIFSKNLIHKSAKNFGKKVRYSFDLRFFSEPEHTTKSYLDLQSKKIIRKH